MTDRVDDLFADLAGEPVTTPPLEDVLRRGDQRRARARGGVATALAVVLVAVGGTTYGLLHSGRTEGLVAARPTPTAPAPSASPLTPVQATTPAPPTPVAPASATPHRAAASPTPTWSAAPVRTTAPALPATAVVTVSPVSAAGVLAPGYTIRSTSTAAAGCFQGVAVGTAYRCFTATDRFDPCFPAAGGLVLYCLADPRSHSVDEVHVPSPVGPLDPPPLEAVGGPQPWAVVLSTGEVCGLIQGAAPLFGAQLARWGCGTGTSTRYLLTPLDRGARTWTGRIVDAQPDTATLPPTTTVTLAQALY